VSGLPIVVTRAGAAGQALAEALAAGGDDVLWLPAFEIGPPPDEARVRALLGRIGEFDLAVFVSPAAVAATAERLVEIWPARTAIAAVGAATRHVIGEMIPGARDMRVLAPPETDRGADPEGAGGSEALWRVLQPALKDVGHALILRAAHGREWLGEQLQAAGVAVETLAVYSRRAAVLAPKAAERLQAWQRERRTPLLAFASSEAVTTVLAILRRVVPVEWVLSGHAVASHDRIAARLRECGFARVTRVSGDAPSIHEAARAQ